LTLNNGGPFTAHLSESRDAESSGLKLNLCEHGKTSLVWHVAETNQNLASCAAGPMPKIWVSINGRGE
jgi:hypothetical protein